MRGPLPEAKRLTKSRAARAKARLAECPDGARWAEAITRLAASRFASGENDRNWVADFDFLLKPDSITKIEEGKYDNRGGPKVPTAAEIAETERRNRELFEEARQMGRPSNADRG